VRRMILCEASAVRDGLKASAFKDGLKASAVRTGLVVVILLSQMLLTTNSHVSAGSCAAQYHCLKGHSDGAQSCRLKGHSDGAQSCRLKGHSDGAQLPPSVFVEGVTGHRQEHNLSCESRSATDLAAFWEVMFDEDDFFRRLPKSDNPHRGFLGDVDLPAGTMPPAGYGVYVGPIAATLRSFGLDAQARREWSLDDLKEELAAGRPAIVWATYDMQLPGVETWVSSDGETSVVVKWQHTFIAIGYDEEGLYLVDAYDGVAKVFSYEAFMPAWDQLGRMAVTVGGPATQSGGRAWKAVDVGGHRCFVVDSRWIAGPE
jgi:uncharacterized protein YvpB